MLSRARRIGDPRSLRDYGVEGQLGLESTAEEYLDNMVEVFREVRRVMHPAATLWLNMGDSYCSDAGMHAPTTLPGNRVPSGWTNRARGITNGVRPQRIRLKQDRDPLRQPSSESAIYKGIRPDGIIKPKDMVMIPARLALALQADGWYLRSQIPWVKLSPMPESVNDRPTNAVEYIYLLAKSQNYFYDSVAVLEACSGNAHARGDGLNAKVKAMGPNSRMNRDRDPSHQTAAKIHSKQNRRFSSAVNGVATSRARRNSDWFFTSVRDYQKTFQGLMVDEDANPLAMMVNSEAFSIEMCDVCKAIYPQAEYKHLASGVKNDKPIRICACSATEWVSHFATFPRRLVTPCVLASTSAHGHCDHCGAPYVRVVDREANQDPYEKNTSARWAREDAKQIRNGDKPHGISMAPGAHFRGGAPTPTTVGWEPSCDHPLFSAGLRPAIVLDPFSGSGRTGLAACAVGRDYIGIELNSNYVDISNFQYTRQTASCA